MENFQSLFIKKRQTSLCTSLFAHSIKDILSRIMFGVNWNDTCAITRKRKTSKNSELDFSIDCVIEDLRSTFLHGCSNTSHRNTLLNSEISLPTVCQQLTIQEAERRIAQEGEEMFARSQGAEETSHELPGLALNTTNKINIFRSSNSNNLTAQGCTTGTGHHLGITSTEGLGVLRQAVWLFTLKILQYTLLKNIFYNVNLTSFQSPDQSQRLSRSVV